MFRELQLINLYTLRELQSVALYFKLGRKLVNLLRFLIHKLIIKLDAGFLPTKHHKNLPLDIPIAGAILGMFSMQICRQGFSHKIRDHVLRDTVFEMYRTVLVSMFSQPVIFDVDVLAAFVMHGIFR